MGARIMVADAGTSPLRAAVLDGTRVVTSSGIPLVVEHRGPGLTEESPET